LAEKGNPLWACRKVTGTKEKGMRTLREMEKDELHSPHSHSTAIQGYFVQLLVGFEKDASRSAKAEDP
jgi:hypothetical protein